MSIGFENIDRSYWEEKSDKVLFSFRFFLFRSHALMGYRNNTAPFTGILHLDPSITSGWFYSVVAETKKKSPVAISSFKTSL